MDSRTSTEHEKRQDGALHAVKVKEEDVDVGALLVSEPDRKITEEEVLRIRRKIDWHMLPMMCILYLVQFMDKTTLSNSAILGLEQDAHLNANQFNWLGTIFYLAYLAFEYPQNLALQRFPVGKWMSVNIFIWAIALTCHAACKSFGALFAVRFILGVCEGAITAGFLIVTAMFYTRKEQNVRVGYWFLMNGVAIIILGFISFGVLHTHTGKVHAWQWLMIITGLLTLVIAVMFWFYFPDSPANARFLTPEERELAVLRLRSNQTGIENKHFKWEQFYETLRDPKTWMFALLIALTQIPNSLTNQRQLIVNQFGFSPIKTTLLGCVDGVVEIVTIYVGVKAIEYTPNSHAYVGAAFVIPAITGSALVIALDFHNKVGLLFSYWTACFFIPCLPLGLGWMNITTAGHTKKISTNGIVLTAYAIANAAGPFMWKQQYKPRNRVPWSVMMACEFAFGILFLIIRAYLALENKRRDAEQAVRTKESDEFDNVYVVNEETGRKVDKAFLDLTDIQNRDFRYPL